MPRLLSTVKGMVAPLHPSLYKIRSGLLTGVQMRLALPHQTKLYLGLYEKEIHRWIRKLTRSANTAIDVGAGQGQYTLYFLLKSKVSRVFAFEPSAANRAEIQYNLNLNGIASSPRLELIPKWANSYSARDEITLDSLIPQMKAPIIVKMELTTLETLKGAVELLKLPKVNWIIETSSDELRESCIWLLERAGYETRTIGAAWWRLTKGENRWVVATKN